MWKILSHEVFAVTTYLTCPFTWTPVQYWGSTHTLLGICHNFRILHPTEKKPSLKKGHVSGSLQYQMWMKSPPLETTASALTDQFSEGLLSYMSNHLNWTARSFLHNLPHAVESVRRAEGFLAWGSAPDEPQRFAQWAPRPSNRPLCHVPTGTRVSPALAPCVLGNPWQPSATCLGWWDRSLFLVASCFKQKRGCELSSFSIVLLSRTVLKAVLCLLLVTSSSAAPNTTALVSESGAGHSWPLHTLANCPSLVSCLK